jgi:Spy/CpxP family protein refolding chaperone
VSKQLVLGMLSAVALMAVLGAQEEGGGGGRGFAGNEAAGAIRLPTRFEQFIGKLKIDARTQGPQASAALREASTEGGPIGQQMAQLQNQLVSALLSNRPETEIKPILEDYKEQATKMIGLEARTFAKALVMGKANPSGAMQAFDIMAGWFQPAPPQAAARGGRAGRASSGTGGGGTPRLDVLIDTFKLTRDQERTVKDLMDEAAKSAAPIRDGLSKTRSAVATAIQAGKAQADIDAAANAYAVQAPAMAELEMRTLAAVMQALTPEQRANQAGVRSTFFLMRNAFITRSWNEVPDPDKGY